ncbi:MAG: preprotein translocase subunit SecG [Lentisphaerae bacterium]|nr:preprotein translocase subunit SecG [Lentisphaerota bacterium]
MLTILVYILLFVEVVSSFLLIVVILIQKPRAHGAGMAFGAGMGESLFGAQMGNVLTRTTVILAIVFLANTTALSVISTVRRPTSVAERIKPTAPPVSPFALPAASEPVSAPPDWTLDSEPVAPADAEPVVDQPTETAPAPVVPSPEEDVDPLPDTTE